MGYRSDVVIAFAFKTREQINEVLAIYQMHEGVQAHDLAKDWSVHEWGMGEDKCFGLIYQAQYVKWYESYEDVQAFEHMRAVVEQFFEQRGDGGFPFAYRKLRIGEEDNDIEHVASSCDSDLEDTLYDRVRLRREIETDF